jgi:anti-sigma regulatory factor (Ser/Thr protein kinase)
VKRNADLVVTLVGEPPSVRVARRSVRSLLRDVVPPETIADALVIVSELATNAVRRESPAFTVQAWVLVMAGQVRLEVHDEGRTTSTPAAPAPGGVEHGLGLQIVAGLAAEMGHDLSSEGTLLWATLAWSTE